MATRSGNKLLEKNGDGILNSVHSSTGALFTNPDPDEARRFFRTKNRKMIHKVMGLKDPVGKWVDWGEDNRFHIIGVVKDYNFEHLSEEISPLALFNNESNGRFLMIKINKSDVQSTVDYIESTWNEMFPTYPFAYTFLNDRYREMYSTEEKSGELFK